MTDGHAPPPPVEAEVAAEIKSFALEVVPFFASLTADDLLITTIKGGTTNQLYMVRNISVVEAAPAEGDAAEPVYPSATPDGYPTAIVVRVYGKDTDKIISRDEELFWQGQFLETYGANKAMLAYEYLDGFRALKPHEFYPRRLQIARRMSEFHAKATQASIYRAPSAESTANQTMVMLTKWIEYVSDIEKTRSLVAPAKQELFDKMGWANGGLIRERDWLLSVINKNIKKLPVAVCHNDFTCGNFMVNERKGEEELRFIDFEYTRLNFTAFDLGNHFCEYGGLECDFTKFPDRSVVREFVREYLEAGRQRSTIAGYVGLHKNAPAPITIAEEEASRPATSSLHKSTSSNGSNSMGDINTYSPLKARPRFDFGSNTFDFGATPPHGPQIANDPIATLHRESVGHPHNTIHHREQQQLQHQKLVTVSDAEVEQATDNALFFALISHFGWAIWGIVQEQVSEIDFGFMDYAWSRWDEYMKRKEEFSKNLV